MKITRVNVFRENLNLLAPYTIAYETIDFVENILFVIYLENGIYGMGTASPAPFVTGETLDDCFNILIKEGVSFLEGEDIRNFQYLLNQAGIHFKKYPAALSAIDIALHDLFAKSIHWPLHQFLGGKSQNKIPTSITIGISDLNQSIHLAKEWIKKGFKILKIKTGISLEDDYEKLIKIREAVGKNILIRIDGNQGYQSGDFSDLIKLINNVPLELVEQPFKRNSFTSNNPFSEEIISIFAADEDLHNVEDASKLIALPEKLYGVFNIKLMKCGGIHQASFIRNLALAKKIKLMWGCNDESRISIMAALHIANASTNTQYLDLDGHLDLGCDFINEDIPIKDGCLLINEGPGLGFTIQKKYSI